MAQVPAPQSSSRIQRRLWKAGRIARLKGQPSGPVPERDVRRG